MGRPPTQEGDADFAESVELELVGGLQERLGVGGVDDERPRVDELQQELQHVGTHAAHGHLQLLTAPLLSHRPGNGGGGESGEGASPDRSESLGATWAGEEFRGRGRQLKHNKKK